MRRSTGSILAATALVAAAGALVAGPLTPPAGPVASTYKTLQQVEPRIDVATLPGDSVAQYYITQPGSYYLSGNIVGASGRRGIVILANNVTLDLNGFAMLGGGVGDDAIFSNAATGLTIRNGTIDGWVKEGLDLFGVNNVRIEGITVRNSSNGFGIIAGNAASVRDCTVVGSSAGFIFGANAVLERCVAQSNAGVGFQLSTGSAASHCTARQNSGNGFFVDSFCTISHSAITGNAGSGVEIVPGVLSEGVRVERCTIAENQLDGIRQTLGTDCSFVDNTLTRNWKSGMRLRDSNQVKGNLVANNGATSGPPEGGIVVAGAANMIDGNTFAFNAPASVVVTAAANSTLVVRNTFTGGTGVTNSGANTTIGAFTSGPGTISSTNTLTNVQH